MGSPSPPLLELLEQEFELELLDLDLDFDIDFWDLFKFNIAEMGVW